MHLEDFIFMNLLSINLSIKMTYILICNQSTLLAFQKWILKILTSDFISKVEIFIQ